MDTLTSYMIQLRDSDFRFIKKCKSSVYFHINYHARKHLIIRVVLWTMLHGLGYRCRIRICVRHGYCSIFVSFSIYLKDQSVIPMSEYVSDTGVGHGCRTRVLSGKWRVHVTKPVDWINLDQNVLKNSLEEAFGSKINHITSLGTSLGFFLWGVKSHHNQPSGVIKIQDDSSL